MRYIQPWLIHTEPFWDMSYYSITQTEKQRLEKVKPFSLGHWAITRLSQYLKYIWTDSEAHAILLSQCIFWKQLHLMAWWPKKGLLMTTIFNNEYLLTSWCLPFLVKYSLGWSRTWTMWGLQEHIPPKHSVLTYWGRCANGNCHKVFWILSMSGHIMEGSLEGQEGKRRPSPSLYHELAPIPNQRVNHSNSMILNFFPATY